MNENEMNIIKPAPKSAETFRQGLDRMREIQTLREPLSLWKDEVNISVDTKGMPFFALIPISDLHFGSEYTDYDYIDKLLNFTRENNVQMLLLGDLGDFFSPKILAEAMMDTVANPDEQSMTIRSFFEEYKDLILSAVSGNHDDWVRKASGVEIYRYLTQDLNIPLLNSGGHLNLDVNGIKYKGLLYHAIGKYNSSFNLTHAGKRMLELQEDADFVISGHQHQFAVEKAQHRDKKVIIASLGSPKTEDMFGKRSYGLGPKPQIGFPVFFFNATKKNIEVIEDMETAQNYLNATKAFIANTPSL